MSWEDLNFGLDDVIAEELTKPGITSVACTLESVDENGARYLLFDGDVVPGEKVEYRCHSMVSAN